MLLYFDFAGKFISYWQVGEDRHRGETPLKQSDAAEILNKSYKASV